MLSKIKQYFYNPLCFKCGSLFVEDHLFCETCFDKDIAPRAELKKRTIQDLDQSVEHFYIFDWAPGESDLLSRLVYQLKSDRCTLALKYYSNILTEQMNQNGIKIDQFNLVIPMPGSQKTSNHAERIAQQIAKNLHLPCVLALVKKSVEGSQKTKTSNQRRRVQIELSEAVSFEQITSLRSQKQSIIYVDDILTTGNTVNAARRSLNIESTSCVITLFFRPTVREQFP